MQSKKHFLLSALQIVLDGFIRAIICNNLLDCYNSDLSYTRNQGLKLARGEYILFLDSDDYLSDNCLHDVLNYGRYNGLDAITFDTLQLSEDGCVISDPNLYIRKNRYEITTGVKLLNEFINNDDLIRIAGGTIYRRELLIKNSINFINGILHEDIPFTLEAYVKAKKVGCLNMSVYNYRRRRKSITSSTNYQKLMDGLRVGHNKMEETFFEL